MAKRTNRDEWTKRLAKWARSGLDLRTFAAREGLEFRTVAWWRWRLGADAKRTVTSTALVPFVELEPEPVMSAPPFEVVLVNGRMVRVPSSFDSNALSRVLSIVDGAA